MRSLSTYSAQARGGADAYAAYYAGMDRSMQQKVALTTAYFPVRGVLCDLGCGSGAGSADLANLHHDLHVIGVDVAPESIAYARAHYQRPNLEYQLGDIAQPLFADASLDGALNSSVFHHLTSFNGFSTAAVRRSLDCQTAALKPGGVIIIRDFVAPARGGAVLLDLPERDGAGEDAGGPVAPLSTARLFERFAADFRSSQNLTQPVPYRRIGTVRPGWVRYQLEHRAACEFALRKDYRQHWDAELREEYTYFTQSEFEHELRERGFAVLLSVELRNPWIVEKRFAGQLFLYDLDERPLPYPPTNYLIVGEKVRRGGGVAFARAPVAAADKPREPQFLRLSFFAHRETGRRFELVERPHPVVDLIPWFRLGDGRVCVIAKQGYPRPLVNVATDSPNLDGAHVAGYLTEPLIASLPAAELAALGPGKLLALLKERGALGQAEVAPEVLGIKEGLRYFTSPGGLNERTTSYLVELAPAAARLFDGAAEVPNYTAFSSAGRVRPLLATQLLRAAQVGGLLDARLEVSTYHLLRELGEPLGPWIGAELTLREQPRCAGLLDQSDLSAMLAVSARAVFAPCEAGEPDFLQVRCAQLCELDAQGRELARTTLEYAEPRPTSTNTVSALPVLRVDGACFVGLETRELPAVQALTGCSRLITNPAWRLPRTIQTLEQAEAFVVQQLGLLFGARVLRTFPLGGKYYPATGATPEVVYPLAVEVDAQSLRCAALAFVPLSELWARRQQLQDGHLLIALWRLAHAVGLLAAPLGG